MQFETELRGQIVIVDVSSFDPPVEGNRSGHPDNWTPSEGHFSEWGLLSEDGEELDWVLTREEKAEIESEILFVMMSEDDGPDEEYW
jgi:hypothetical protein